MSQDLIQEGRWAIDRMLATGKTDKRLWVSQTLPRYRRNRACWFAGAVDRSGFSVYNDLGGIRRAGTLVGSERRRVLLAPHYGVTKGTEMRFVDPTGAPEHRTVVKVTNHPHYTRHPTICDIQIAELDEPCSLRISPLPILPVDLLLDFPLHMRSRPGDERHLLTGLPMFGTDFEEKWILVEGTYYHRFNATMYHPTVDYDMAEVYFGTPISFGERALKVTEPFISGDSGSPVVALWEGQLCLVTVLTQSYAGTSIPDEFEVIRDQMGVPDLEWA